jgi:hypothetical protein
MAVTWNGKCVRLVWESKTFGKTLCACLEPTVEVKIYVVAFYTPLLA